MVQLSLYKLKNKNGEFGRIRNPDDAFEENFIAVEKCREMPYYDALALGANPDKLKALKEEMGRKYGPGKYEARINRGGPGGDAKKQRINYRLAKKQGRARPCGWQRIFEFVVGGDDDG